MRSLKRQQQDIFFASVYERLEGIDTIQEWSKPIKVKMTAGVSSGNPNEIAAGIVPDYDKTLVYYKSRYKPSLELEEGMSVWVDAFPELDENGNLVIGEDEITPVTPPDYILKRILDTKRGSIVRYGIIKIGGSE